MWYGVDPKTAAIVCVQYAVLFDQQAMHITEKGVADVVSAIHLRTGLLPDVGFMAPSDS